ncbi:homocysteine S-methyltransferase family protein [Leadbettera azotonutricia]|uniref:Methionine synthase n=1 Tax=Leadbettera azotonutricia (strain ATCC BAA-888 / DSM 13862 / ZAS-9) TaxID=545695 RepID=F5YF48_LEAAZ|nr:homocysteine S-methyltransferase family protein [Leadbettera azotonutricia]AEF81863.1 methionine synthase [Leadbettera azotonutricia ZAS-9]
MDTRSLLNQIASERIIILDGAMGSMLQALHPGPVDGCNDMLNITKPGLITGIHEAYLEAGADIIETCSFNATSISLKDYDLENRAYEISRAAGAIAKKAADKFSTAQKPRFAAGSLGPTAKSASITSDIDNPLNRAVAWDGLEAAYYDNARGLIDGGVDLLFIETVFDSLNAKAALFAIRRIEQERGVSIPVMVSATLSEGGRLLTGQTLEGFCRAMLPANPWALSLNCSFGADSLKPHLARLSAASPCLVGAYPNAGLPDRQGNYSQTPAIMASHIESYLKEGLVNIIGGCCGSTPAHIAAIASLAKNYKPRVPASVNAFQAAIDSGDYEEAVELAREKAERGAKTLILNTDKSRDPGGTAKNFIFLSNCFPVLAELQLIIESENWETIEAALKCVQGCALVRYKNAKEDSAEYREKVRLIRDYGGRII